MKALIWLGCTFVYVFIVNGLKWSGIILGGIPTMILGAAALYAATQFCKMYDEKHVKPNEENYKPTEKEKWVCLNCGQENDHAFLICKKCGSNRSKMTIEKKSKDTTVMKDIPTAIVIESQNIENKAITSVPIFCRKCGNKLIPNSAFCSKCGTKVIFDDVDCETPQENIYHSVDSVLASTQFNEAYNELSTDQKQKFFVTDNTKLDAARIVYSIYQLIDSPCTIPQIFEIYITICSRLMLFHMAPERIAGTLDIRYGNLLDKTQQYIFIAFSETHINGMESGFYIQNEQDVNRIKTIAQSRMLYPSLVTATSGVSSQSSTFGFSIDDPIQANSIPASYSYLDRLKYRNGEVIGYQRIGSVDGKNGEILDCYSIKVATNEGEKETTLYINAYSESTSYIAPKGFYLQL